MTTWNGGCRCGAVRYEAATRAPRLVNCHCGLCRSLNGAAFSSYAVVAAAGLSVVSGRESLAEYRVTETATKHFCARCGTPLFNTNPGRYPGAAMIYLGTLDQAGALHPSVDLYCADRLAWVAPNSDAVHLGQGPEELAAR